MGKINKSGKMIDSYAFGRFGFESDDRITLDKGFYVKLSGKTYRRPDKTELKTACDIISSKMR